MNITKFRTIPEDLKITTKVIPFSIKSLKIKSQFITINKKENSDMIIAILKTTRLTKSLILLLIYQLLGAFSLYFLTRILKDIGEGAAPTLSSFYFSYLQFYLIFLDLC